MKKRREERYGSFGEIRRDLERLQPEETAGAINAPKSDVTAFDWTLKGNSLHSLGRDEEAIICADKALEIDPRAETWFNKGESLHSLGRDEEAIICYDRALEIDPRYAAAWFNRAVTKEEMGQVREAVRSYRQFIALAKPQSQRQIQYAHKRLRELEGM